MIKDDGIRALIPGVVSVSDEKETQDTREYIRKKLDTELDRFEMNQKFKKLPNFCS